MSGVNRLPTKYINCSDNFHFVKLNPFFRAVLHYGMRLPLGTFIPTQKAENQMILGFSYILVCFYFNFYSFPFQQ